VENAFKKTCAPVVKDITVPVVSILNVLSRVWMAAVVLESIGVVVGKVLSDLNVNQKLKKKVKRIPKIKMFQKRGPERNSSKISINVQNNRNAVIFINLLQNNGLIFVFILIEKYSEKWGSAPKRIPRNGLLLNSYIEMSFDSKIWKLRKKRWKPNSN